MDDLRLLAEARGFFTRADALSRGYRDGDLTAAVRADLVVRFRRGSYAFVDVWRGYDDARRHVVRCRAVLRSLGPGFALSHVSSVLVQGGVVWGHCLDRVHVTRLDGRSSRVEADVTFHAGRLTEDDVVEVDGMLVTRPDRAAIEAASLADGERALVVFDSMTHLGLCTPEDLLHRSDLMADWPNTRRLHIPLRMVEPGADGPGESRGRWLFRQHRIPQPVVQHEVRTPDGELIGTTDWWWREFRLLGEFDGQWKYRRLLRPGQDPGEVVFGEKNREDRMREATGCGMVRLIWSDYSRPTVTAQRIRRMLGLS
ncbi:hypothetical protein [uncultured Nocardioides sp.]|uniref:type IV toxin-antitoxin system AbiEi family antitoxin domain-containing protein n=1 Tax=uncultured Nocardioides sp. TaxID=198441 RepID=UPI00262F058C|nr:hypothetical protein [uncultured Nocardioides sp.]